MEIIRAAGRALTGEYDAPAGLSNLRRRSTGDEPTIAALVGDPGSGVRIRAALATLGAPYFAASPDELLDVLVRHRVRAVIVECDGVGGRVENLVRVIRRDFPALPVLIYCELTAEHMKRVPTLIRAGADELVIRGVDDMRSVFRRVLVQAASGKATSQTLRALREVVPKAAEPVLAYCLAQAHRPLTVSEMARDLGVHRKTLCNRALAAGLPAPSILISWCRLLHAAQLLDDSRRSVERTALILGFGSGTALRNMLRRYTGLRPSELRFQGGHGTVLTLLQRRLAQSAAYVYQGQTPTTAS